MKKIHHFLLLIYFISTALYSYSDSNNIETISTQKIVGEEGVSYSFTVFFEDQLFITYRKSNSHDKGDPGKIQIHNSLEG